MRIPAKLLPHRVALKPYLGSGAYGEKWGESEYLDRCLVEGKMQNITNSTGQQEVSASTVYMEPRSLPVGSMVTLWPGTDWEDEAKVIAVMHLDHPQGMSHTIAYLK